MRSILVLGLASILSAGATDAAEWQQLDASAIGLFDGGASAVSNDGEVVFGHADVVQGGGSMAHTPLRWIRQPDGSFLADALGEGATTLDLPRGIAIDASADGTAAALYGLSKWTEAGGIACGSFCPPQNENTAISADGTSVASTTFLSPGPGQRALLWSDTGIDIIDEVTTPGFGQFHVWDLSADGTVAVGEYPGTADAEPVIWTRIGPNDWSRTLPGLPPGAGAARAYRISDDGLSALVQWSPTDYSNLGFGTILWSVANGYEDISVSGCRPDALNANGTVAVGRCDPSLGRWTRANGWEVFPAILSFAAQDLSADGRYAVGHGNYGRWADLGPALADCENGSDDDGDGRIDFGTGASNDPGCASATDLSENTPTLPCDDGIDNDADGYTDFPSDPACVSLLYSDRENSKCQDGINNDGDALIDFDGGASRNGGVPLTEPDPQCVGKPARDSEKPGTCGLGAELPLVFGWLAWSRRRATRRPRA